MTQGVGILDPWLREHGFVYRSLDAGTSSGGNYASGRFMKGIRSLQFHYRHDLGMVTYHLGERSMSHEGYMWAVLGKQHASHYPGFSDDPMDGFHHLLLDLQEHCSDFIDGTDERLLERIDEVQALLAQNMRKLPE